MVERTRLPATSQRLTHAGLRVVMGCGVLVGCAGADGTEVSGLESVGLPNGRVAASLAESHPIAFTSGPVAAEGADLYLMALDGSMLQVTQAAAIDRPRWSPSGAAIAFREQVENTSAEVALVAPDGTERVLLTSGEEPIFWLFPVNWAPDETRLAFASRRDPETTRIWVVPREGGPTRRLFDDDTTDRRELAWSADGRRIAYGDYDRAAARHDDGISKDIWVADAAAPSQAVNLTAGRVHSPVDLQWSPDSRSIAFQAFARSADGSVEGIGAHDEAGPYLPPDRETFVLDADTGTLLRVTDDAAGEKGLAWSPDGTQLLVSSELDGDYDVWLIPLEDPTQARNLIDDAESPRHDEAPDWFRGRR